MDSLQRLRGRPVVVLGLARQGVALARFLVSRGARVTVSDMKADTALGKEIGQLAGLPVEFSLGGHPLELLDAAEMLCLSGGVPADLPIVAEARRKGLEVSSDAEIFFEASPARIVGITGSAGKTTTTMLVGRMADRASEAGEIGRVWVGGNIGHPLLNDVDAMRPGDLAVMELSSFQLDLVSRSPQVAAVLNVTPNHLDRHHTMDAYRAAKAHILDFQAPADSAVLGWQDAEARNLRGRVRGECAYFSNGGRAWSEDGAYVEDGSLVWSRAGRSQIVLPLPSIELRGMHNLSNAAAACAIAGMAGIAPAHMARGIEGFRGAPHRLEKVARVNGADWYDDSIATAPERAMAALRAFQEPIVLLAGGRDKKLPWADWAGLVREKVDHLVLFGESAGMIESVLGAAAAGGRPFSVDRCATLDEAVAAASRAAAPGDVVLLSPGGTSFDAFKDFEERGNRFRALAEELARGGDA